LNQLYLKKENIDTNYSLLTTNFDQTNSAISNNL